MNLAKTQPFLFGGALAFFNTKALGRDLFLMQLHTPVSHVVTALMSWSLGPSLGENPYRSHSTTKKGCLMLDCCRALGNHVGNSIYVNKQIYIYIHIYKKIRYVLYVFQKRYNPNQQDKPCILSFQNLPYMTKHPGFHQLHLVPTSKTPRQANWLSS